MPSIATQTIKDAQATPEEWQNARDKNHETHIVQDYVLDVTASDTGILACCTHGDVAYVGDSGPHYGQTPHGVCGCPIAIPGDHVISPGWAIIRHGSRWTANYPPGRNNTPTLKFPDIAILEHLTLGYISADSTDKDQFQIALCSGTGNCMVTFITTPCHLELDLAAIDHVWLNLYHSKSFGDMLICSQYVGATMLMCGLNTTRAEQVTIALASCAFQFWADHSAPDDTRINLTAQMQADPACMRLVNICIAPSATRVAGLTPVTGAVANEMFLENTRCFGWSDGASGKYNQRTNFRMWLQRQHTNNRRIQGSTAGGDFWARNCARAFAAAPFNLTVDIP